MQFPAPLVTYQLAGAANGKPGYYSIDKNNCRAAIAVAYFRL